MENEEKMSFLDSIIGSCQIDWLDNYNWFIECWQVLGVWDQLRQACVAQIENSDGKAFAVARFIESTRKSTQLSKTLIGRSTPMEMTAGFHLLDQANAVLKAYALFLGTCRL